ncbi:MAG TPA: tetratricopeptide repeat protein [Balneolaceae bacterium]
MFINTLRHFLLTTLLLAFTLSAPAQVPELIDNPEFRTDAKAAVDSIYNFNFDGADERLSTWKGKYPDHPLWTLIDGMKFWWKVLSDLQDTSHDEQFYHIMKKASYQAGKLLYDHPSHVDGLIIKAISNGYMARQYANRSEWLTSLNYARKAMNAYEYLLEVNPGLPDLKLAEGLKLYYSAYLPEAYPIVQTVSWFLPDGNKQKGLELIRIASENAIFAQAEATYFLGNINYNYEENYARAIHSFEKLHSQYPNNNYYARILVKAYYKQNRYDEALDFIDRTLARWQRDSLPYLKVMQEELLSWKGRILDRIGLDAEALESFKKAFRAGEELPATQSRSFHAYSGYYAGKILYEQEKLDKAATYLKKVAGADVESSYPERAEELLSKIR